MEVCLQAPLNATIGKVITELGLVAESQRPFCMSHQSAQPRVPMHPLTALETSSLPYNSLTSDHNPSSQTF